MTKSKLTWLVAVAAVLVVSTWAVRRGRSADPTAQSSTKWAYARIVIAGGKVTIHEADKQSTVQAPQNRLSGNVARGNISGDRYTVSSKVARDDEMGAMNLLGSQGWEAVSVRRMGADVIILMKRAY